jgi:hypothetical protein
VIDVHAWREAVGSLRATSSAGGFADSKKESEPCCKQCCSCDFCKCDCCKCDIKNCNLYRWAFPECCFRCYQADATERIMYHGTDEFEMGHRLGDDVYATKTINDNYKWNIYKTKKDDISITMHYVHLLDGEVKCCHMKVRTEIGEDTDLVYKNAQKFVSMIAKHRTRVDPPKTLRYGVPIPMQYSPYKATNPFAALASASRPLFYTENDRRMHEVRLQAAAEASMKYGVAGDIFNLIKPIIKPLLDNIGLGDIADLAGDAMDLVGAEE